MGGSGGQSSRPAWPIEQIPSNKAKKNHYFFFKNKHVYICMCAWDGPLCGNKPEADAVCPHQLLFTSFLGKKVSYWSSNSWFPLVWLDRKLQGSAYLLFLVLELYTWITVLDFAWDLGTWSLSLNACTELTELSLITST